MSYIETGRETPSLLGAGFTARGSNYKKSYSRSIIGATKPYISVEARNTRSGPSCSAQFGIIGRNDGFMLFDTAKRAAVANGYQPAAIAGRKGQHGAGYMKGDVTLQIGGRTKSSHSTYSTFLYFQRYN
ncbi:hypothetical protein [Leisingera sp. M658]|uniref:hypothetical protein n=1 Tax=Leisingera sp. M658 TaxID=2867015 RepID=UPI0021A5278F|nr:hypothetical protein [Leisingera sp. M658]UWQ75580.1 hypothetical protein K3724_03685 [Leisingera sp. M658]